MRFGNVRQAVTLLSAAAILAFAQAHAASASISIEGRWLTDDGKGIIRISSCGADLCGYIAEVLDKTPGVPRTDVNNPDPHLRSQRLVGLRTLWGFRRDGAEWNGGRAYDPESGKSYRSTLALQPDGSLKVTGCVFVICESRRWTRAR